MELVSEVPRRKSAKSYPVTAPVKVKVLAGILLRKHVGLVAARIGAEAQIMASSDPIKAKGQKVGHRALEVILAV